MTQHLQPASGACTAIPSCILLEQQSFPCAPGVSMPVTSCQTPAAAAQQRESPALTPCREQEPQQPLQQPAQRICGNRSFSRRVQQLMSHKGPVCSLLVMAQVLRLLVALSTDPASATISPQLRSQLTKEVKAAAAAALMDGEQQLTSLALLKHLHPARLHQIRAAAAARKHPLKASPPAPRPHAVPTASDDSGSSCSTDDSGAHRPLFRPAAACPQQRWQQMFPQPLLTQLPQPQPPTLDVGCLLETTLVAAAAEAQLNSFSLGDPSSDSLADDASSPVDIEGVMQEELAIAQQSGLL